jgi:hypothetical protein
VTEGSAIVVAVVVVAVLSEGEVGVSPLQAMARTDTAAHRHASP